MSIKARLQRLEKAATESKEARAKDLQTRGIVELGHFTIYRHGYGQDFECHRCGASVGPKQESALFTGDGHEWRYCDACFGAFLDTFDAYWQERIRRTYALYGEAPPATWPKLDATAQDCAARLGLAYERRKTGYGDLETTLAGWAETG